MFTPSAFPHLWGLALNNSSIDPDELAGAIEAQLSESSPDFRTRLLVRDAVTALGQVRGEKWVQQWLAASSVGAKIGSIACEDLGPAGFTSIARRMMNQAKAETAIQLLRELGSSINQPASISVGGSMALILADCLSRRTEAIDVFDELPASISSEHQLLNSLAARYDLKLIHFQSHYLPTAWEKRLKSLGRFGRLDVLLVDVTDVWLSKLFSAREKDRDDLRLVARPVDKSVLEARLKDSCAALLAEPDLRANAVNNWYIVFGEKLPV